MSNVKNDFNSDYVTLLRNEAYSLLEPLLKQAELVDDWASHIELQMKIAEQFAHIEECLALMGKNDTTTGLVAKAA